MDIKSACRLVMKKYPGRIPVGYWKQDGLIIVNTKTSAIFKGMAAPCQFAVTTGGDVYGINPMMYNLSLENMKKL